MRTRSTHACSGNCSIKNTAALQTLEPRYEDKARKANTLLDLINELRAEDGLPPRPPFDGSSDPASNSPFKNLLPTHSESTATVVPVIKSGTFSAEADDARKAFFEYKKDHPEEPQELSPLQKRMQSGGAIEFHELGGQ